VNWSGLGFVGNFYLGDVVVVAFHVLETDFLWGSDIPGYVVSGYMELYTWSCGNGRSKHHALMAIADTELRYDRTYQKATTACEETSSVPATIIFVSALQATDRTGAALSRNKALVNASHRTNPIS
jgi:hypothetical protein